MSFALRPLPAALFAACLSCVTSTVQAQAFDAVRLYGAAPGTDGGLVGAALIVGTEYAGSDERRTMLLPALDYQWRSGWFAGTTNGIGYDFAGRPDMQYGLRLTADLGRSESRSPALAGMGDIDATPTYGAFFNYAPTRQTFLTSSLRYGSGNNADGMVLDLGAVYLHPLAPQWSLAVGAALSVVNAAYMQSYFGVTAAQSASGYAAYTPSAGLRDVRANLSLTHQFSNRFGVTGVLSLSSLQGDARDSPIVRQATTTTGVLAVTYAF